MLNSILSIFMEDSKPIKKKYLRERMKYASEYILQNLRHSKYFTVDGSSAFALQKAWVDARLPNMPSNTVLFINIIQFNSFEWNSAWESKFPTEKYAPVVVSQPLVFGKTKLPGISNGDHCLLVRVFFRPTSNTPSDSCLAILPLISLYSGMHGANHIEGCSQGNICIIPGIVSKHVLGETTIANEKRLREESQDYECSTFQKATLRDAQAVER